MCVALQHTCEVCAPMTLRRSAQWSYVYTVRGQNTLTHVHGETPSCQGSRPGQEPGQDGIPAQPCTSSSLSDRPNLSASRLSHQAGGADTVTVSWQSWGVKWICVCGALGGSPRATTGVQQKGTNVSAGVVTSCQRGPGISRDAGACPPAGSGKGGLSVHGCAR